MQFYFILFQNYNESLHQLMHFMLHSKGKMSRKFLEKMNKIQTYEIFKKIFDFKYHSISKH